MIPLHRAQFPNSKADLAEAMNESLRRYVRKDGDPIVTISARVFAYLDEIAISTLTARRLIQLCRSLSRPSEKQGRPAKLPA